MTNDERLATETAFEIAATEGPLLRHEYTPEEREHMLSLMESATRAFYRMAQFTGYHQFLEHAGIMAEQTKICRHAAAQGLDFPTTVRLPILTHSAAYIGEKIGCMFGDSFAGNEELIRAFCLKAFGVEVKIVK